MRCENKFSKTVDIEATRCFRSGIRCILKKRGVNWFLDEAKAMQARNKIRPIHNYFLAEVLKNFSIAPLLFASSCQGDEYLHKRYWVTCKVN